MFLRKLTVIVVPVILLFVLCLVVPALNGLGFVSDVLKGTLIGVTLALLLPLSGASRRKEPFAVLLWLPALLTLLVVLYQFLSSTGTRLPALEALATTDGEVIMTECIVGMFMLVTCLRTTR